ncbi:hypothetical protein B0H14DRAFT_1384751 [Mycena olivaceomarginata]|nr:hypothetical protein B0H14DRAFT_1384751 [Mycena olivaceomarginata]
MSAAASNQTETSKSNALLHEQVDLGQLPMAHAQSQAYPDASSSPGNQTPITSEVPAPEPEKSFQEMSIWEILFQNNEADPVNFTAILNRAWGILVLLVLGVSFFLVFSSDSESSPPSEIEGDRLASGSCGSTPPRENNGLENPQYLRSIDPWHLQSCVDISRANSSTNRLGLDDRCYLGADVCTSRGIHAR